MEFGAGSFTFNEESYPFKKARLASEQKAKHYLGLPQWGVSEWKGNFYSQDCSTKNMLGQYAQLLNCVEVSSTFYSQVAPSTLENWRKTVDENFRFLPKWPKAITHDRNLVNCKEEIKSFVMQMEALEHNLGATILQLPPSFSRYYAREFYQFLCQIPKDLPLTVEFRHSSWFENHRVYKKLEEYFEKTNIGMVICDTPGRRDLCHYSLTSKHTVIRFLSDQNRDTDDLRLKSWRQWLDSVDRGGNIYFVLHRPENDLTPDLISSYCPETYERIQEKLAGPQQNLFS